MRVLIIDDSILVAQKLQELLDDLEQVEFIGVAADGQQGIESFRQFYPDLVLLDIKLQKLNGIQVLQQIKAFNPNAIVIVFTNFSNSYFRDVCMMEGADFFLDKSVEFLQIKELLKNISSSYN